MALEQSMYWNDPQKLDRYPAVVSQMYLGLSGSITAITSFSTKEADDVSQQGPDERE